jgi:hypothetical protein
MRCSQQRSRTSQLVHTKLSDDFAPLQVPVSNVHVVDDPALQVSCMTMHHTHASCKVHICSYMGGAATCLVDDWLNHKAASTGLKGISSI